MKRNLKKLAALLLAASLMLLAGCQNQPVLSRRLLIRGIGVDVLEDGGYLASIHVMDVRSKESDKVDLWKSEGESVMEALNHVTMQMGDAPLYSQNLIIIFGRGCVEQGLTDVLDFFIRHNEARPTVDVFMSATKAIDVLSVKKDDQYVLTQDIDALAEAGSLNGESVNMQVLDLVNYQYSGASPYLPVIRAEIDEIKLDGTAFLKGDKLAGFLDAGQTRGLLLINNTVEQSAVVVDGGDAGKATLVISGSKCNVDTKIEGGKPVFDLKISCDANISAIHADVKKRIGGGYYELFERELAAHLKSETESVLQKALLENRCDIFRFGRRLLQKQTDFWRREGDNWDELMAQSEYRVSVEAHIQRVGQEITPNLAESY